MIATLISTLLVCSGVLFFFTVPPYLLSGVEVNEPLEVGALSSSIRLGGIFE